MGKMAGQQSQLTLDRWKIVKSPCWRNFLKVCAFFRAPPFLNLVFLWCVLCKFHILGLYLFYTVIFFLCSQFINAIHWVPLDKTLNHWRLGFPLEIPKCNCLTSPCCLFSQAFCNLSILPVRLRTNTTNCSSLVNQITLLNRCTFMGSDEAVFLNL